MPGNTSAHSQQPLTRSAFCCRPYTVYKADWAAANSMEDMDVTHHRTYRYGADAVVAFGSGQSLTSFALSFGKTDTHLTPPGMAEIPTASGATAGGGATYEVKVTNTGRLVGDEIVMAYFVPTAIGLKVHPARSLFDFQRAADVAPGASITLALTVTHDSVLLATAAGDLMREPGSYALLFEDGAGQQLKAQLKLPGSQVVVEPFPEPFA